MFQCWCLLTTVSSFALPVVIPAADHPSRHLPFPGSWRSKPTAASVSPFNTSFLSPSSVNSPSRAAAVFALTWWWWAEARGDVTTVLPADWQLLVPGPHPAENSAGRVGAVAFGESLPRSSGEGGLRQCQAGFGGVCSVVNETTDGFFNWWKDKLTNSFSQRIVSELQLWKRFSHSQNVTKFQ